MQALAGVGRDPGRESVTESERLERSGARLEVLLDELRGMTGPSAWSHVEEVVARIVDLYGAGLARCLAHARGAGADPERLRSAVAGDALVASLLAVAEPGSLADRVEAALEAVRPTLAAHGGGVELARIAEDGSIHLRWLGTCHGCPSSSATLEHLVTRAIADAAPEVTGVVILERS